MRNALIGSILAILTLVSGGCPPAHQEIRAVAVGPEKTMEPAGDRKEEAHLKMERIGSVLRARLDCGLTVLFKENHHAPVVAVQVWVGVGSADEEEGEEGMAHLHEHMLFKGTATRGVGEIAKAIEAAGGDINAWTSFDNTVYHVVLASRHLDLGLEVLADAVQNAIFDPQELEREKKVVLEEIKRTRDMPSRLIGDLLFGTAYQRHPYSHPILGSEASVSGVTRKDILRFFKKHYRPDRMTLLVVGDMQPQAVLKKIRQLFLKKAPAGGKARRARIEEPVQRKLRVKVIRDDIQEVHFTLGWHAPAAKDPQVPPLEVLAVALGQGESSRLNLGLRHGLNLVNDIYAYLYAPRDPGLFLVGGSCPPGQLLPALRQLSTELARMSGVPATAAELAKAKTMIENDTLYLQETVEGTARRLGAYQTLIGDPSYGDVYLSRVMAVTPDDIKDAAQSYLTPDNLSLVVMLPNKASEKIDETAIRRALKEGVSAAAAVQAKAAPEKEVTRVKIKNGPLVLIQEDHTNALVSMRGVFLGGMRYEKEANNGINNFLAGMITRGTSSRSAEDIAREMDAIAGNIDGFSGRNTFGLRAECPSRYFNRALDLFADCLLHPAFGEKELKRERELVLEDIRSREDNLSGLTFDLFASTLFSSHPYRMPVLGTRQSVVGISQRGLNEYMRKYYTPDRMVLSVVGDIDEQQVLKRIKKLFTVKKPRSKIKVPTIRLDPPPKKVRRAIRHRSRAQAHLVLGFMGTTLTSKDRHALEVLMAVLAGQGGRLFVELRDRLSLAYAVSGFSLEGIEPGYVAVYLGVDPNRVEEAVEAVRNQLNEIVATPVKKAELERAKQYLIGIQAISLQRTSARATALAFNELYGLGHLAHREYPERILKIKADDVARVAKKYLKLKAYILAVVRPKTP
jgi:zinc protease